MTDADRRLFAQPLALALLGQVRRTKGGRRRVLPAPSELPLSPFAHALLAPPTLSIVLPLALRCSTSSGSTATRWAGGATG
jgi:hypothetical protein